MGLILLSKGRASRHRVETPLERARLQIVGGYRTTGALEVGAAVTDHDGVAGKHRRAGMKVLIACTPAGRPAWISAPVNGKHHDMYLWNQLGLSAGSDPFAFCGDTAFTGSGMTVPLKKPRKAEFEPWEKEYNEVISEILF